MLLNLKSNMKQCHKCHTEYNSTIEAALCAKFGCGEGRATGTKKKAGTIAYKDQEPKITLGDMLKI